MTLRHLIMLISVTLLLSNCGTRVEYIPCPDFSYNTRHPVLNLDGNMTKISDDYWKVSNSLVLGVKEFEKSCLEHDADFDTMIEAINKYNLELEEQ